METELAPPDFERLAGRGIAKKWRLTIRIVEEDGTPGCCLGDWLAAHGLQLKTRRKCRRVAESMSPNDASAEEPEPKRVPSPDRTFDSGEENSAIMPGALHAPWLSAAHPMGLQLPMLWGPAGHPPLRVVCGSMPGMLLLPSGRVVVAAGTPQACEVSLEEFACMARAPTGISYMDSILVVTCDGSSVVPLGKWLGTNQLQSFSRQSGSTNTVQALHPDSPRDDGGAESAPGGAAHAPAGPPTHGGAGDAAAAVAASPESSSSDDSGGTLAGVILSGGLEDEALFQWLDQELCSMICEDLGDVDLPAVCDAELAPVATSPPLLLPVPTPEVAREAAAPVLAHVPELAPEHAPPPPPAEAVAGEADGVEAAPLVAVKPAAHQDAVALMAQYLDGALEAPPLDLVRLSAPPSVGTRPVDLRQLFKMVGEMGGYEVVTALERWPLVAANMALDADGTGGSAHIALRVHYLDYLLRFEQLCGEWRGLSATVGSTDVYARCGARAGGGAPVAASAPSERPLPGSWVPCAALL